jgi:acyl-CoA reductase-like NAD-dependent aldehyde dehydrogenase
MKQRFDVISPVDGSTVLSMDEASPGQIARTLDVAQGAAKTWRQSAVADRVAVVMAFTEALSEMRDEVTESLTMCMGRPSRFAGGEVDGTIDRAQFMAGIAEESLADVRPRATRNFKRRIAQKPLGVVLILSP